MSIQLYEAKLARASTREFLFLGNRIKEKWWNLLISLPAYKRYAAIFPYLALNSPFIWLTTKYELLKAFSLFATKLLARRIPIISVSFSEKLMVTLNLNRKEWSIISSVAVLALLWFLCPWNWIIHQLRDSSHILASLEVLNLTIKFAKICNFIAIRGYYRMSYCPSSTMHLINCPKALRQCNTTLKG